MDTAEQDHAVPLPSSFHADVFVEHILANGFWIPKKRVFKASAPPILVRDHSIRRQLGLNRIFNLVFVLGAQFEKFE